MPVLLAYCAILFCYLVLVHQYYVAAKNGAASLAGAVCHKRDLKHFNRRHTVGLLAMLLGVLCYYQLPVANRHWLLPSLNGAAALLTVVVGVVAMALSYLQGFRALRHKNVVYTARQGDAYLLLRLLFLVVYELFFRGVLLGCALAFTSVAMAVAINVALYVLAHGFSARRELVGSLLFGLVLCWLTLVHQSVWPAVALHLLLALPCEGILISKNKNAMQTYGS